MIDKLKDGETRNISITLYDRLLQPHQRNVNVTRYKHEKYNEYEIKFSIYTFYICVTKYMVSARTLIGKRNRTSYLWHKYDGCTLKDCIQVSLSSMIAAATPNVALVVIDEPTEVVNPLF